MVVLKNTDAELLLFLFMVFLIWVTQKELRALASDSAGKLNVFGHDGDALGVDGT